MKIDFDANKEGSNKDTGFWKTIKDNCGVHGKKNPIVSLIYLVGNHGNKQNCMKIVVDINKEVN